VRFHEVAADTSINRVFVKENIGSALPTRKELQKFWEAALGSIFRDDFGGFNFTGFSSIENGLFCC
jgi:hypothetical protein